MVATLGIKASEFYKSIPADGSFTNSGIESRPKERSLADIVSRAGTTLKRTLTFNLLEDTNSVNVALKELKAGSHFSNVSGDAVWEAEHKYSMSKRSRKALESSILNDGYIIEGDVMSRLQYADGEGGWGKFQKYLNKALDVTYLSNVVGHLEVYRNAETGKGLDFNRNAYISPEGNATIAGLLVLGPAAATTSASLASSLASYAKFSGGMNVLSAVSDGLQQSQNHIAQNIGSYAGVAALGILGGLTGSYFSIARAGTAAAQVGLARSGHSKAARIAGIAGTGLSMAAVAGCSSMAYAQETDNATSELTLTGDPNATDERPLTNPKIKLTEVPSITDEVTISLTGDTSLQPPGTVRTDDGKLYTIDPRTHQITSLVAADTINTDMPADNDNYFHIPKGHKIWHTYGTARPNDNELQLHIHNGNFDISGMKFEHIQNESDLPRSLRDDYDVGAKMHSMADAKFRIVTREGNFVSDVVETPDRRLVAGAFHDSQGNEVDTARFIQNGRLAPGVRYVESCFYDSMDTANPNDDKLHVFATVLKGGDGHRHHPTITHKHGPCPEPKPGQVDEPNLNANQIIEYTTDRGWEGLQGKHPAYTLDGKTMIIHSGDHIGVGVNDVAALQGYDSRTDVNHPDGSQVYGRKTIPSKIKNVFLPADQEWDRYKIFKTQDGSRGEQIVLDGNNGIYGTNGGHPDEVKFKYHNPPTQGGHQILGKSHTLLGGVRADETNNGRDDYNLHTIVANGTRDNPNVVGERNQPVHVEPMRNSTAYAAGVITGAGGTYGIMSTTTTAGDTVINVVKPTLNGGQAGYPPPGVIK